jgi:hypothetical protein
MLDQLAVFIKGTLALAIIIVAISSIYVYRVWTQDTSRRVKLSIMGFSIELGEARQQEKETMPDIYTGD